ncbi:MAG TPA: hypothetical protein VE090_00370 [Methylomirabilota bacterium]|nr:hypothetical protein [Methylomirabilota bacterium]
MKAERVILSFVAVIVGLVAAGIAFYLYQMTRVVPAQKDKPIAMMPKDSPSPTPDNANILTVESPSDQTVFDKKIITITGKTRSDATILVNSENTDQVVKPASNGNFSITQTIPDGTTLLHITAVFPNGQEQTITRTVTFSTENF